MTTVAPPRPIDTTAATDAEFEALIREARRRARRRRVTFAVIAASVTAVVVAGFLMTAARQEPATPPPAGAVQAAETMAEPPAAGVQVDLVLSMYLHHMFSRYGDVWLYVYDDGRVIRNGSTGWEQRQLTAKGLDEIDAMMVGAGLFDPAILATIPEYESCCGYIQARIDGDFVVLPHTVQPVDGEDGYDGVPPRYRPVTPFALVAERLMTLTSWLPDDMWVADDPTPYEPASYALGLGATDPGWNEPLPYSQAQIESLLPPGAASFLRAASAIPPVSVETDRLYGERTLPNLTSPWGRISSDEADAMVAALLAGGWQAYPAWDRTYVQHHLDALLHVDLVPMLPHGVPANTYG